MPENRYSGSVDEIIEKVKRSQEGQPPSDDREVDAILASLGLGEQGEGPAHGPLTGSGRRESLSAADEQVRTAAGPDSPPQKPVREAAEAPAPTAAPIEAPPAAPVPEPSISRQPAQGQKRAAPAADKTPKQPPEGARSAPSQPSQQETTGEICLDFVRAGLEQPAPPPTEQAPAPESSQTDSQAAPPQQEEAESAAAELRRRFEKAAAQSVGADGEFDGSFVDFFSDHVAVIPEEGEEASRLFNRFGKKRKKEEFAQAAQEPTILMPGVSEPGPDEDEDPTGEVRLNLALQDETGQIDTRLVADAVETARQNRGPRQDDEPTQEAAPRRRFRFFGDDEAQPPFEGTELEEEERTPDYDSLEDAPAVRASLRSASARAALSTAVAGILSIALLYLGISASGVFPALLDPNQTPQAFLGVELLLLLVAAAFCAPALKAGFGGLFAGKASPDSLTVLALVGCVLQCAAALLLPKSYDPVHLTLYAPLAALLLFANAAGRQIDAGVVKENFELLTAGVDHSAAYRLQNVELTSLLADGLEEERPALLVSRPTSLIKGFLRKSASRPRSDRGLQKLAWALGLVALLCAIVSYIKAKDALQAVSVLAAVLCLGAPLCTTLFSALCAQLQQRSAAKVGAVVPGWGAVEELGRINTIVAGAKDLFPRGGVVLQGIKTFEKERIDLAILYAASVLVAGCDTLRDVFLNIIQNKTEMLYPVENLVNERGRGFTAWIDGSRVILGNRNMMTAHEIDIPSVDYENRYTKGEKQPIYLAVSGKLFGMFVVDYRASKETASVLRVLQRSGISLLVNSDDFAVTGPLIEKVYRLRPGSVKVLTGQELDHLSTATGYLPESEGCMVHLGSFASYVGGLRAAAGAASAQYSSCLILCASVLLGIVVGAVLTLSGGLLDLALPAIILYQIAWAVPTLALPLAKKY